MLVTGTSVCAYKLNWKVCMCVLLLSSIVPIVPECSHVSMIGIDAKHDTMAMLQCTHTHPYLHAVAY